MECLEGLTEKKHHIALLSFIISIYFPTANKFAMDSVALLIFLWASYRTPYIQMSLKQSFMPKRHNKEHITFQQPLTP